MQCVRNSYQAGLQAAGTCLGHGCAGALSAKLDREIARVAAGKRPRFDAEDLGFIDAADSGGGFASACLFKFAQTVA